MTKEKSDNEIDEILKESSQNVNSGTSPAQQKFLQGK